MILCLKLCKAVMCGYACGAKYLLPMPVLAISKPALGKSAAAAIPSALPVLLTVPRRFWEASSAVLRLTEPWSSSDMVLQHNSLPVREPQDALPTTPFQRWRGAARAWSRGLLATAGRPVGCLRWRAVPKPVQYDNKLNVSSSPTAVSTVVI